jgi:hypothetical protein
VASARRSILSLYIVATLFLAIIAVGVVGSLRNGNYVVLAVVFTALAICVLAVMFAHYRVTLLLRDRTPDRIITHYHRSVRRIPHANAAAAYLSALAAAFFGQYDRARSELDTVDWDSTTPVYRGHRLYVLATLAVLEETNYPKALALAAQARELENSEQGGGLQALDDVNHSGGGERYSHRTPRLEKIARKQKGLMGGMCAWALAVHYKRNGQPDKAADFKEFLRMSVPYSAPMLKPPQESS